MRKAILTLIFFVIYCAAVGSVEAQTARRIIFFTTLPATCNLTTGDVAMLTSGTPTGLYYCSAANVWSPVGTTGTDRVLLFGPVALSAFSTDYTGITGTSPGVIGVKTATATTLHQYTGEQQGANALPVYVDYLKTRATDTSANTIIVSQDQIAAIRGYGADGADFQPAAQIDFVSDTTPGVGDMPGRIGFWTSTDGAATLVERFRVDNAGTWSNLLALPAATLTAVITPTELISATNALTQYAVVEMGANTTAAGFTAFKTRATTSAATTIIVSGDDALSIRAYGADGLAYIPLATITMESGGTPGANDMPGQIGFWLTADGAATLTERWRINESGTLTPVTSGAVNLGTSSVFLNDIFTNEVRNGGSPATPVGFAGAYFSVGVAFANLGAPTNGYFTYCTDCDAPADGAAAITCASSPGTGAFAVRKNSAWKCF